ncbi:MAG: N-acetylglucosamine-6-phosphate deacetylase [Chloroflexota bacterium]
MTAGRTGSRLAIVGQILGRRGFLPGRLLIADGRIAAVESGDHFAAADADWYLPDRYIGPGLIDLQINGGLGGDFSAEPRAAVDVARFLPSTGVTGFLPTLITGPMERMMASTEQLANIIADQPAGADLLGSHLEGPFIHPDHRGAHDSRFIRPPSIEDLRALLEAGGGTVRIVTLAPELPGALDMVTHLRRQGVVASAGHSGASYAEATAAFDAGVSWVTHLFNGQRSLHHREPGLVGAALVRAGLVVGLIADGVHTHPAVCDLVFHCKGPAGVALVTDAVAGMGLGPGRYSLGGREIEVDATAAWLPEDGRLAGSVLTLDRAVTNMGAFAHLSLQEAWRMASAVPAKLLGLADRGHLEAGGLADVVILSPRRRVELTLKRGQVVFQASPQVGCIPLKCSP